MAQAKIDIKTEATRPFYTGVGVTDLAVQWVRDYVAGLQQQVGELDFEPRALRAQAVIAVSMRVGALAQEAKARQAAIEGGVAQLQADAKALPGRVQALVSQNVATANTRYADMAKRGQELITRIRGQESTKAAVKSARTTVAKAKATKTQATKAGEETTKSASATGKRAAAGARNSTTSPRSSAKATATAPKKTAAEAVDAVTDAAEKIGD